MLSAQVKFWAGLVIAGLLAGAGVKIYSEIRDAGYRECRVEVDSDTADLNDKFDRLEKKHRDLSRAYQAMLGRNAALQSELDDAARQDPDADRPAFGPDSVQRLNQIR